MKIKNIVKLVLISLVLSFGSHAQIINMTRQIKKMYFKERSQYTSINKSLSKLIDSLKEEDQRPAKLQNSDSAAKEFQKITKSNFSLIKSILNQYGFPGYDLVGKESSDNYWLIVQHSDFDVRFQKRALALMKYQVLKKNASGQKYAYLIDRVNINEGRKQLYGTQVNMGENGTTLKPCMDSTHLDIRRKEMGLPPIKEYLLKCNQVFQEMNKERLSKTK